MSEKQRRFVTVPLFLAMCERPSVVWQPWLAGLKHFDSTDLASRSWESVSWASRLLWNDPVECVPLWANERPWNELLMSV